MIYASVCSGVEAASLAWMPLGWKAAWFSEIEPFPCEVLKQRFPDVPNLGDMTKIKGEEYRGTVDLLVGGTPCQGFSVAGKQGGLNDPRSGLAMSYCRLLETMRPRWFVWENVPGVFSTGGGEDFKTFIRAIDEIGYSVAWRVLDAQYVRVDGFPRAVPQRRRRVFVVGHLGADWRYPASVLFEPEILYRNTPPRRTEGKSITGDSAVCSGTAGRFWDESGVNPTLNQCSQNSGTIGASNQELFSQDANGIVMCVESGQTCATVNIEHSPSLTCNHDHPYVGVFNSHAGGSARSISYSEDCSFTLGTEHAPAICYENHRQDARIRKVDCSPTIAAKAGTGGGNLPIVQSFAIAENIIGRKPENGGNGNGFSEELAYTQNTCGIMGIANNSKLRYLLPVECERLMGFPEVDVLEIGKMTKDEFIAWEISTGNIVVDTENGLVYSTRTGGGRKAEEPILLKGCETPTGYLVVSLREKEDKRQCRIHRIVWIAAHGIPPAGMTVDHIDNNKKNNRLDNLQLMTAVGNSMKAHSDGIVGHKSKITEEQSNEIVTLYQEHAIPIRKLAEVYGISKSRVHQLIHRDDWTRIPWRGKPAEQCPDSPRYKACGNSMCVNVMRWIGMRIEQVERKIK